MFYKYRDGSVELSFHDRLNNCSATVVNGGCVEVLKPGKSYEMYHNGKLVCQKLYDGWSRHVRNGVRLMKCDVLGPFSGVLWQRTKNGSFYKEEFVYDCNRKTAYKVTNGDKKVEVDYPDGKKWFVWESGQTGKISFRTARVIGSNVVDILPGAFDVTSHDSRFERFDVNSNLVLSGQYRFHQKVGEWIVGDKYEYFLRGVSVSKNDYFAKPEDLNVLKILQDDNVQRRAALLDKIGTDNIVKYLQKDKCGAKVIHRDGDMELISVPMEPASDVMRLRNGDSYLVFLKVVCPSTGTRYFLRVPPGSLNCEVARQWTFGVVGTLEGRNLQNAIEFEQEW